MTALLEQKSVRAYVLLASLVICGLASALVTGCKVVHMGVDFPFSNLVFSIFTYPLVDCICELWGKKAAQQTMWLALGSQLLIALLIQWSIVAPSPVYWTWQNEYQMVLAVSDKVIIASLLAFSISQILDIVVYQRIKELCRGRYLWLRSNVSTYLGQSVDSLIFVLIVFAQSAQKYHILFGSIAVKIVLSLLMTPVVYLVVMGVHWYLECETFAFDG